MLSNEEAKLSIKDIKEQINKLEKTPYSDLRNAKLVHLRLVLKYKYAQEKQELAKLIKLRLGIDRVSGSFTKEDTAKALGITERQQLVIEQRALKLLKRPSTGKLLKDAFLN